MKHLFIGIMSVWFVTVGLCLEVPFAQAEIIDKIVAILDDELILLSEIRECIEKPSVQLIANLGTSSDREQDALQYMIERRLLQKEIQYLATPKDREPILSVAKRYLINTYYDENTQAFDQQIQVRGMTEANLEEELELYIKGVDYIRRKYRFNADIDDPDVVLNLFHKWLKELKVKAKIQTSF